jgi:hypothetical protein
VLHSEYPSSLNFPRHRLLAGQAIKQAAPIVAYTKKPETTRALKRHRVLRYQDQYRVLSGVAATDGCCCVLLVLTFGTGTWSTLATSAKLHEGFLGIDSLYQPSRVIREQHRRRRSSQGRQRWRWRLYCQQTHFFPSGSRVLVCARDRISAILSNSNADSNPFV